MVMVACTSGPADGPAEIKWDRDACKSCSMVISERHFAAQVRGGPKSAVAKFDDVGCALKWLDQQPWADEPATKLWVAHQGDGHWLDAKTARFQPGKSSPMGFGYGAVEAGGEGVDFDTLRDGVRGFLRRKQ